MFVTGVPDLLTSSRLMRDGASVARELDRSGDELTTGIRKDLVSASGGDLAKLFSLDRAIAEAGAYENAIELAQGRATVIQASMEGLQAAADEIGVDLLASVSREDFLSARRNAGGARDAFSTAVASLNATFAGRSLFAGAAVDAPALDTADQILGDVFAVMAGATDAAGVIAAADAYFDGSGPAPTFDDAYLGSAADAPAVQLGADDRFDYALRADRTEVRDLLRGLALAAFAAEGGVPGDPDSEEVLLTEAGESLVASRGDVIDMRANFGLAEERIETAKARNAAEATTLSIARNDVVSKDAFEAASEFEALRAQLEAVYTVTARLSGLTLTAFLR